MDRDILSHLPIVLNVARRQSFAAAAAALHMSPSAVSHAVRTVEDRLGEPLFARTTRSVSLTEAGQRFLDQVGPALDEIAAAFETLSAARGDVTGVLRLNASRVAIHIALTPILAELATRHPRLTVELHTNDAFVDIVAQGFDAGVRLGPAVQQDMVAVRMTPPFRAILIASPAYLATHGAPQMVRDLAQHNCIGFRLLGSGSVYDWELEEGGRTIEVETSGTLRVTDGTSVRDLVLAGIGIGYIFEPLVRRDLASGDLVQLLPQSAIQEDGLFLYYPRRASLAPKLRALVEVTKALSLRPGGGPAPDGRHASGLTRL